MHLKLISEGGHTRVSSPVFRLNSPIFRGFRNVVINLVLAIARSKLSYKLEAS